MDLVQLAVTPLDVGLVDPFVIASTRLDTVHNVAVEVVLGDGTRGWGEIPTLPPVTREDQPTALAAAGALARELPVPVDEVPAWLADRAPELPAVRAGVEMAVLDARARARGVPLHRWFGDAGATVHTDITVPICTPARAAELVAGYRRRGFTVLKVKVGVELGDDLARLEAIGRVHPHADLVLDANEGWTVAQTLEAVQVLHARGQRVALLEQPVPRDDLDGLGRLTREAGVPVAADEAVRAVDDARIIARGRLASVLNLKLVKCGVAASLAIRDVAREHGLGLMIGGMVETRIAMGFAAHLVRGLGGFGFVDLDTPLLLATDPVAGGPSLDGPRWQFDDAVPGHGARPG